MNETFEIAEIDYALVEARARKLRAEAFRTGVVSAARWLVSLVRPAPARARTA